MRMQIHEPLSKWQAVSRLQPEFEICCSRSRKYCFQRTGGAILAHELRAAIVDRRAPRSHTCRGSELCLGCQAMRK